MSLVLQHVLYSFFLVLYFLSFSYGFYIFNEHIFNGDRRLFENFMRPVAIEHDLVYSFRINAIVLSKRNFIEKFCNRIESIRFNYA